MATSAEVTITSKFADGKTRKATFGPLATADLVNVKSRIIERNNAEYREQNYSGFDNGFVSAGGASFVGFSAAQIVVTDETVLY